MLEAGKVQIGWVVCRGVPNALSWDISRSHALVTLISPNDAEGVGRKCNRELECIFDPELAINVIRKLS